MKRITKNCIAICLGTALISSVAFASDAYYGAPKNLQATAGSKAYSAVVLRNYTYDAYVSDATFNVTRTYNRLDLLPYGSGYDVITYQINPPDTQVCLTITQKNPPYRVIFSGCVFPGHDVNVGPFLAKAVAGKTQELPPVKVVPHAN